MPRVQSSEPRSTVIVQTRPPHNTTCAKHSAAPRICWGLAGICGHDIGQHDKCGGPSRPARGGFWPAFAAMKMASIDKHGGPSRPARGGFYTTTSAPDTGHAQPGAPPINIKIRVQVMLATCSLTRERWPAVISCRRSKDARASLRAGHVSIFRLGRGALFP